jgi:hypothetical protein
MRWLKQNWPWLLYGVTGLNFAVLLYVPYWLGKKLGCAISPPDLYSLLCVNDFSGFRSCLSSSNPLGVPLFGQLHTFGADLLFPVLLAISLTVLTLNAANHAPRFMKHPTSLKVTITAFMPAAYAISDYVENALVWRWLLSNQATVSTTHITTATTLKFTFFVCALAILIMFTLGRLKQRNSRANRL